MSLSVTVIMCDEANNIGRCLESVRWADEIVVIDGGSEDDSVEIARRYTPNVLVNSWPGFGPQKNFAVEKTTCDWVFSLDADEEVTPELAAEIRAVIADPSEKRAFLIPRRTLFCGRFLRYGDAYPDYQFRLFRRGAGRFSDRPVHETLQVDGPVGRLKCDMSHYSIPNIEVQMRKLDLYSTLGAQHLRSRGRKVRGFEFFTRPTFKFVRRYIVRQGYRDGRQGLVYAALSAMLVFVRLAKAWEMELQESAGVES